jgi:hypothetical protein
MGVGHAAVALSAGTAAPRLNVGWLVFAAFLADFLLGIFASIGLEGATAPPNYATSHYLLFTFPYSHGLVPLLLWAAIAGCLVSLLQNRDRMQVFFVLSAVVLSHFVLDALVHVAGLPLAGENSPKIGFGLWKHLRFELTLESLMTVGGIVLYLRFAGPHPSAASRYGMPIFMGLLAVLTWTQLLVTNPPKTAQLAPNWIIAPLLFGVIAYLLDRKRAATASI